VPSVLKDFDLETNPSPTPSYTKSLKAPWKSGPSRAA